MRGLSCVDIYNISYMSDILDAYAEYAQDVADMAEEQNR